MSEPTTPPAEEEEEHDDLPADPLLQPGSFINPQQQHDGPPDHETTTTTTTPQKKNKKKKKTKKSDTPPTIKQTPPPPPPPPAAGGVVPERPSWLPEGWKMESKVRTSGATAGTIDRYYFEPDSNKRFRSKKEVEFYLETGTTKKKSDYPAVVNSSEIPASSKKKSSSETKRKQHGVAADRSEGPADIKKEKSVSGTKRKKHDKAGDVQLSKSPAGSKKKSGLGSKKGSHLPPQKFDFDNVPEMVTWKLTDASTDHWTPFVEDEMVPKSVREEWDAAVQSLISDGHK